jgi:glycine betaine catabolism A
MSVAVTERHEVGIQELIASRRPGFSLEQPFYNDPEIFRLDIERIFKSYWLYAGHVSRIPNRGDYFLFEIPGESLIIIRDQNLEIQALYNVCRHRGSLVCREPAGEVKGLVCPYHHWTYKTRWVTSGSAPHAGGF